MASKTLSNETYVVAAPPDDSTCVPSQNSLKAHDVPRAEFVAYLWLRDDDERAKPRTGALLSTDSRVPGATPASQDLCNRRRLRCAEGSARRRRRAPLRPRANGRPASSRPLVPLAVATLSVRLSTSATIAVFEGPHRQRIRQPQHSRKALCSSRTTIEPRYTQPPPSAARETTRTSGKVCIASVRAR
jgi:hypothetical protein